MNKMLITGLPLSSREPSNETPCNIEYMDLFVHPSYLMWADKIVIPSPIWDLIKEYTYGWQREAGVLKLIIDMLNDADLVEIIDTSEILTSEVWDSIDKEIEDDTEVFTNIFPQLNNQYQNQNMIYINGYEYCLPRMRYVYSSLYIAQKTNSNCMFNDDAIHLCNSKFGISNLNRGLKSNFVFQGMAEVFSTVLPEDMWTPSYLVLGKCRECESMKQVCHDKFLSETEKEISQYLSWRDYDEVIQIKHVLNEIIAHKRERDGLLSPNEIKGKFEQRKKKYERLLHKRFPKIKRWARYVTLLSVPAGLVSLSTGNIGAGIAAEAIGGISTISSFAIEGFEQKHNWINFTLQR